MHQVRLHHHQIRVMHVYVIHFAEVIQENPIMVMLVIKFLIIISDIIVKIITYIQGI
jgi:hypothetical protein